MNMLCRGKWLIYSRKGGVVFRFVRRIKWAFYVYIGKSSSFRSMYLWLRNAFVKCMNKYTYYSETNYERDLQLTFWFEFALYNVEVPYEFMQYTLCLNTKPSILEGRGLLKFCSLIPLLVPSWFWHRHWIRLDVWQGLFVLSTKQRCELVWSSIPDWKLI